MKKLMFAAAVAAMAMGASAYYTCPNVDAYFTDNGTAYTKAYIVSKADSEAWDGTVAGIGNITTLYLLDSTLLSADNNVWFYDYGSYDESIYNNFKDKGTGDFAAIVASESLDDAFVINCSAYEPDYDNYSIEIGFSNMSSPYDPSAVPEPTSALLMLLGMAGLALRRKQA